MKKLLLFTVIVLSGLYSCGYQSSTLNDRRGEKVPSFDTFSKNDSVTPNNSMNSNASTDNAEDPRNGNGKGSGM
ncbi:MAG TPA: hypothetical protein VNW99_03680 [Cytophagaceae bacterium]|jgi:hypothetical protein|nr:hypothetical protein [Cytophagaceae bacterium]